MAKYDTIFKRLIQTCPEAFVLFALVANAAQAQPNADMPVYLDKFYTGHPTTDHWADVANNKLWFTPDAPRDHQRFVEIYVDSVAIQSVSADTLRVRFDFPKGVTIEGIYFYDGVGKPNPITALNGYHILPDSTGFDVSSFQWLVGGAGGSIQRGHLGVVKLRGLSDALPDSTTIVATISEIGTSQPLPLIKYYKPKFYWDRDTIYVPERNPGGDVVSVNLYGKHLTHGLVGEPDTRDGKTAQVFRVKTDRIVNYFRLGLSRMDGGYLTSTGIRGIEVVIPDSSLFAGGVEEQTRTEHRDRQVGIEVGTFAPIPAGDGFIATYVFTLGGGIWASAGWVDIQRDISQFGFSSSVADCINNDCKSTANHRHVYVKNNLRLTFLNRPAPTESLHAIDYNEDGKVDFADFLVFVGHFRARSTQADLNRDGRVTFDDFFTFARYYRESTQTTYETLTVELEDGRIVSVPLNGYPRLVHATSKKRNNWELHAASQHIYWEDLDEDISVEDLLAGRRSGESQASFKRWLEARKAGRGVTLCELRRAQKQNV